MHIFRGAVFACVMLFASLALKHFIKGDENDENDKPLDVVVIEENNVVQKQ